MKKFLKRNLVFLLIGLFVLINIILITYNFVILKQRKSGYQKFIKQRQLSGISQLNQNIQSDFYNFPCPDITKYTIKGEEIQFSDLAGNVIILRFSRFYRQDLPNLVYLQHLANKYRDQGVSLIFINSLGKHDNEAINKIVNLTAPILEDEGSISALFNAQPEETIIVDRNFTIKFKHRLVKKAVIYNEVIKWTYADQPRPISISEDELAKIIQNLTFYDVLNKERKRVDQIKEKGLLLTLFTSTCTGCEEITRIQLLKEITPKVDLRKVEILLLFGKGNNPRAIRQYAILNEWDEFPITIGVIEDSKDLSDREYRIL
ncbi:MAG: peroxiredoxin family protein [Candidatus Aminicenantia bacterium]